MSEKPTVRVVDTGTGIGTGIGIGAVTGTGTGVVTGARDVAA
jgi:hypothetical protein